MLVEREGCLAVLADALEDALGGRGRLIFVGGEAGVGKSSVVAAATERAAGRIAVRRGWADNVTTAAALGPFVEAVPELAATIDAAAGVSRFRLFRGLRTVLADGPALLVLEDVHWADEATLDLLGYLGRRLDGLPLLVLATYRVEEVSPRHRLADVMGELATARGVTRLPIEPLTPAAVAELAAAAGSDVDPAALHGRTGGNAFFVTEVLAAAPADDLPASVRDAVLARVNRRSEGARSVLAAAAVLGQPADAELLAEVAAQRVERVAECVDHGLLIGDRHVWAFRHDLARLAVEQTIGQAQVAALNRRAFEALLGRGVGDDRRLAHHAAAGGDRAAANRHAVRAAARAGRLGAHREAADQYRLALRFADGGPVERAELLVALSYECYLTDDQEAALSARLQAMELAQLAGDAQAVGRHERWVSRLTWFLGRNVESERYAERAIATLEPLGDSPDLAMAYSNRAQLCMLGSDAVAAERWGERAIAVARRVGDRDTEIHALNNIGVAKSEQGDDEGGRALLHRSLDLALAADAHEHAARAYTNLGSFAVAERRFELGDTDLRAGIAYCTDHDLTSWSLYMSAQLARSLAEQGCYPEAADLAADVLRHSRLSPITEIVATAAAAVVGCRRGADVADLLDRAWTLAVRTGEPQRLATAAAALAEAAWLTGHGDAGDAGDALDVAWSAVTAHPSSWEVAEVAHWRAITGRPAPSPVALPRPFALMQQQAWAAAADAWRALGCPLWAAYALAADPSLEAAREALRIVDALDAPAVRAAILRRRYEAGLPVPRGPRAPSRGNAASLTPREYEVLGLLADGLSNAEIAARLFLSEKTAGHHVSAVLRKLGEPTRARAVAAAVRSGLVAQT